VNNPDNVNREIEEIFSLISSAQFEQAEIRCKTVLDRNPDDINALGLLGMVLLRLGKTKDARSVLQKTIRLEPRFAKPHEDLGMLCLHEGDVEGALRYFEEAIRLDGNQANAYAGLAQALARLGRYDEARKAKDHHLRLSPVAQALAKANELLAAGNTEQADEVCNQISVQHPSHADILRLQARIASQDGRLTIAEGLLKRIIKLSPTNSRAYADLGRFLGQQDRYSEAVDALEKAIELDSTVISSHQMHADYLSVLGRPTPALHSYEAALQLDPEFSPALVGRGHMLRILGRWDEAIDAYESAIKISPKFGDAWWSLAGLKRYRFSPDQVRQMQDSLAATHDSVDSEISLHFALARSFENESDFESAWQHYELGNLRKRETIRYDPVKTEVSHDAVIDFFNADLFAGKNPPQSDGPAPIFIVGMPRAGSTLLEQILASHSQVEGAAELPYIGMLSAALGGKHSGEKIYPGVLADMSDEQIESIGKAYLYYSESNRPQKLPRFTDKMPSNFSYVGLIRLALPNAKIIDSRRHPLDACVANYRQLYAKGKNHAYDLNECAEYFLEYDRVMNHWDEVLPGFVLRVQYEDVIDDVETQVRRLLDFCELPWEDDCLKFYETERPVNTASMEQVRQPIYSDAVSYWENYEPHLDEIKEILAPVLDN
jgi:tetratricopeptide (TPR) repeat protein